MILSYLVTQTLRDVPVGLALGRYLKEFQEQRGYKVLSVTETRDEYDRQAFIVIFDNCDNREENN